MKRLLGYVVKLPDGTRSALTKKPVPFRQASCTASADDHARGHVLTPVFAVRKSVVVPTQVTTEAEVRAFNALEPKSAPVEAGERYAVFFGDENGGHFGALDRRGNEIAPREVAADGGENKLYGGQLVRVLPDGEHEAAVAKAREEGAEALRIEREAGMEALRRLGDLVIDHQKRIDKLRSALEEIQDSFEGGMSELSPHTSTLLSFVLGEEQDEVAKGCAE